MKIVSSAKMKRSIQERLQEKYKTVHFAFHERLEEAEVDLSDADVWITYGDDLQAEHIKRAIRLKWIMVLSAGVDQLPFKAIKERNILVTNARGIHAIPMAEYTISMMLQVARQVKALWKQEEKHLWDQRIRIEEITGKTIAILGTGAIGKEIARLAKAFRMTTLGYNRSGNSVSGFDQIFTGDQWHEALSRADFVVSVLPLTPETNRMIGKEHFQAMKKEAVFINIGRGATVSEEDLLYALKYGEIAHAVLDVFAKEPLERNHPFWDMENVTVTPHLSAVSRHYQNRAFEIFEHNLNVYISQNGEYLNKIDLDLRY